MSKGDTRLRAEYREVIIAKFYEKKRLKKWTTEVFAFGELGIAKSSYYTFVKSNNKVMYETAKSILGPLLGPLCFENGEFDAMIEQDEKCDILISLSPSDPPVALSSPPWLRHRTSPTPLIGRESNIAEATEGFRQARLVTLIGSGGVGKTRLSIAVAEVLSAEVDDRVWFVELADIADIANQELVESALAQALDIQEQSGETVRDKIENNLSARSLLVIDNCEHVLAECARLIAELLRSCPELRVLATSREALGIPGEWIFRVPSLEVPPFPLSDDDMEGDKSSMSHLREYSSVRLFLERAAAQPIRRRDTPTQLAAITKICIQLDGIPLAIEMAAARVSVMPLKEILLRLQRHFRLLVTPSPTALPKHQTLRAVMDWSYDLLNVQEATLLIRLSVFRKGATLEAVESVGTGHDIEDLEVLDLLTSLVRKNLVGYEEWEEQGRYRLLETVRQYAEEKLVASGQAETVREKHRDYFLAVAEQAQVELKGGDQGECLQRLETEHENLRAAQDWSLSAEGGSEGLRFCGALHRFWRMRGYFTEGRKRCSLALSKPGAEQWTRERADALNTAGILALDQSDYASAQTYLEESLSIIRLFEDQSGIAMVLNNLGSVAFYQGDIPASRIYDEESLKIKREIGDRGNIAYSLLNLGVTASAQTDYTAAVAYFAESLILSREETDHYNIADALNNLGSLAIGMNDFVKALAYFTESLQIRERIGDQSGIASSLGSLGIVANHNHDYAASRNYFEQTLLIFSKIGEPRDIGITHHNLGNVIFAQGDYALARQHQRESLKIRKKIGDQMGAAFCLESIAAIMVTQGEEEPPAQLFGAAHTTRISIGTPLPPNDREEYDRILDILRTSMGPKRFQTAWDEGSNMTLEQAIQLALDAGV